METWPWWALLLTGAGGISLVWLLIGWLVVIPQRRALENRLAESKRQLEYLTDQRTDREARVMTLEGRLAESEHLRLSAETQSGERAAEVARLNEQVAILDQLRAQAEALSAQVAALEEERTANRQRIAELVSAQDTLTSERDNLRTELAATDEHRRALASQAEALRWQAADARYQAELRGARLQVAAGELLAQTIERQLSRRWRDRSADLLALEALRDELTDYHRALANARNHLDEIEPQTKANEGSAEAASIAAEVAALSSGIRELAEQAAVLSESDANDGQAIADSMPGAEGTAAPGVLSYLRGIFDSIAAGIAPPATPREPVTTSEGDSTLPPRDE